MSQFKKCLSIYLAWRYKIIVAVTILEKLDQGVQSSWGFLWDHERDNYAYHIKETPTFTALATVVGLYYEWRYV